MSEKLIENTGDIEQENLAAFQLSRHLTALGIPAVSIDITPKERKDIYDLEMRVCGMWSAVIEVRSVNAASHEYAPVGPLKGFLLEHNKLENMRKMFFRKAEVSGKWYWRKECIILWRCINDETCWGINLREIARRWDEIEEAPPEYFKSDHGKEASQNKKKGYFIPITWLEKIE